MAGVTPCAVLCRVPVPTAFRSGGIQASWDGMRDKFQDPHQTAIGFDVQVFGVCVGNVEQLRNVAVHQMPPSSISGSPKCQALARGTRGRAYGCSRESRLRDRPSSPSKGMIVVIEVSIAAQDAAAVVAADDIVLVKAALRACGDRPQWRFPDRCDRRSDHRASLTLTSNILLIGCSAPQLSQIRVSFIFCFLHSVFVGLLILHGDNI